MVDFDLIKKLIKILEDADITALSVEEGGMKVEIRKEKGGQPVIISGPAKQETPHNITSSSTTLKAEKVEEVEEGITPIVSPMVGTFYRAPSPDSPSYVEVGDEVEPGKIVCIIEAMKLFNEIEAEVKGKVTKILVENGQPVEYGQKLFLIKKEE